LTITKIERYSFETETPLVANIQIFTAWTF
jgi:hypothetical protein